MILKKLKKIFEKKPAEKKIKKKELKKNKMRLEEEIRSNYEEPAHMQQG